MTLEILNQETPASAKGNLVYTKHNYIVTDSFYDLQKLVHYVLITPSTHILLNGCHIRMCYKLTEALASVA